MLINNTEAQAKLEKLAKNTDTFQFALSPEGFLLVSKGNVVEVADFKLFHNGKYYRRNGFKFQTNMLLNKKGLFLCSFGKEKFVANCGEAGFEYASGKKALDPDFCTVVQMRFSERIILLIADGIFANKAIMVTLADNHDNELFAASFIRMLVGSRNEDAAYALLSGDEEDDGKK